MTIAKLDLTTHSPAALHRPRRSRTDSMVLHHFGADIDRNGVVTRDEMVRFFVEDPEGIATVALPGSYASKVPTIQRWRKSGPPYISDDGVDCTELGYVAYHFVVDGAGVVARMLPLEARGAHAGNWNDRSIAICFLGDFAKVAPNDDELAAGIEVARDIMKVYAGALILGHDETIIMDKGTPKGCPGPMFPLDTFRDMVRQVRP